MYQKSVFRVSTVFPLMSNVARVLPFETLLEAGGTLLWRSSKAHPGSPPAIDVPEGFSSHIWRNWVLEGLIGLPRVERPGADSMQGPFPAMGH